MFVKKIGILKLKSVVLNIHPMITGLLGGNGITSVDRDAFKGLRNLKVIELPNISITGKTKHAFDNLKHHITIYVRPDTMGCNCDFLDFLWLKFGYSVIMCRKYASGTSWRQLILKDLALDNGCGLCPREKDDIIFSNGLQWKSLHVASSIGSDHDHCGRVKDPCKTIKYAINTARTNVNLLLHGGRDAVYNITSPIKIDFSVNITKKYDKSINNPTLHCTTNIAFVLTNKVHFHLQSVNIVGSSETLNVVVLRSISVGRISISNVNVNMVNNNTRVTMVLLALFQSAETITIIASHIQGVFVKISGASYICDRSTQNTTISYSTANTGIEIKGGQYNFDFILVTHSSFQNNIFHLQHSKSSIQSIQITKTTTSNGFTIKEPSTSYNNPDYDPRDIIPKEALTEIAIIARTNNTSISSVSYFYAKNVNAKNILTIKDMYPVTAPILIGTIHVNESKCDYCLTAELSSVEVASMIVTNTTVEREIVSIHKGKFVLEEFSFINNEIQSHSKAISYQSYATEGNIVLRNGLIEWNVQNSSKPIIDLKVVPGTAKIENLKIKPSSQREIKVLFLEEKLSDTQNVTNVSIICSDNSNISSIIRSGELWILIDVRCRPCDFGFYSLRHGSVDITTPVTHRMKDLKNQSTDATCKECPMGAICDNGIKSGDNFYGYKVTDQDLTFTQCPTDYCCELDECKTFSSCSSNRAGLLCGNCASGYQESFFNTGCVEVRKCNSVVSFWFLLLMTTSGIVIWFAFTKEIKQIGGLLKNALSKLASKVFTKEPSQEESVEKTRKLTVSAAFNILVGFYQVKKLMSVKLSERYRTDGFDIQSYISDVFNLEFFIKSSESFCPTIGLSAISKGVLKNFVTPLIMLTYLLIALLLHGIYKVFSRRFVYHFKSVLTWQQRIGLTYIKLLLFSYKNIATFCVVLVYCVDINDSNVLFIHADTKCFQWWQKLMMIFLGIWVIPFPGALMISYRMLMARKISFKEFIASTMFPFYTLRLYFKTSHLDVNYSKEYRQEKLFQNLKELFEEPYRLIDGSNDSYVFWETWRLYQRLILTFAITFAAHPIIRTYVATMVVIIFMVVYAYAQPYKQELYALRLMEATSLAGLSLALGDAMFNSYVHIYQIPKYQVASPLKSLAVLNVAVTPLYAIVFVYAVEPVLEKLGNTFPRTSDDE